MGDLGVVVGVTGRYQNTDALRYAAREAAVEGCAVTLAHVGDRGAARLLREVEEELQALTNHTLAVRTFVCHGLVGPVLARLSASARLLVLQHRVLPPMRRAVTGSTVTAVAARARCPVASIPVGGVLGHAGVVVACVHRDGGPREVLHAAFTEAERHDGEVRLLHACRPRSAYDPVSLHDHEWRTRLETSLRHVACEVDHSRGSKLDVVVRSDWRDDAILNLSEQAGLLVLGRHGSHGPSSFRLGSLARVAVQGAACPVLLVPV